MLQNAGQGELEWAGMSMNLVTLKEEQIDWLLAQGVLPSVMNLCSLNGPRDPKMKTPAGAGTKAGPDQGVCECYAIFISTNDTFQLIEANVIAGPGIATHRDPFPVPHLLHVFPSPARTISRTDLAEGTVI